MGEKHLDTFWRAAGTESIGLQRSARGNPILSGQLAVFNVWTEIRSPIEGHFMERLLPSVFKKTIMERAKQIRVLFQHGRDAIAGDKPLGTIIDLPNDGTSQRYEVELFDVSYVNDLLPALEQGQFGSSFSARDIRSTTEHNPERSDVNPQGIMEVSREELMLREFGPVTFPAYEGATAGLRSVTDDFIQPALRELLAVLGIQVPVGTSTMNIAPSWVDNFSEPAKLRAVALDKIEEPEPEREATTSENEPQHSAEEDVNESEEEMPSWQLRR